MADANGPFVGGRDGRAHDLAALAAAAAALAAELPAPTPGSHVAFAFEHDHAAFAVALAAVWQRGHAVALPRDARRYAVGPTLRLPEVAAFVHDTGAGTGVCVPDRAWPVAGAAAPANWLAPGALTVCDPDAAFVVARAPLSAAELGQQVTAFARAGLLAAGDRLAVTVAPGHPPALVPGLLGPLQVGASVVAAVGLATAALLERLHAHAVTHLLTSPDRLRELASLPAAALPPLRSVWSLGTPDAATVARWRDVHGVVVHSLVSSTAAERAAQPLVAAMLARDGVDDVAVVSLTPPGEPGPRWFVAVAGASLPRAELARHAATACPGEPAPIVTTVERLRRDVNGGLPASAVLHACGRRADGAVPKRALGWGEPRRDGDRVAVPVVLPADYAGFDGHFVGHPVLSGAVQLHDLVLPALRRALGRFVAPSDYGELKFLARISPGESVEVVLTFGADGRSVTFVVVRGDVNCTTGRASWGES